MQQVPRIDDNRHDLCGSSSRDPTPARPRRPQLFEEFDVGDSAVGDRTESPSKNAPGLTSWAMTVAPPSRIGQHRDFQRDDELVDCLQLRSELTRNNIGLGVLDGCLRVVDPDQKLTEELLDAIRDHKGTLLALLSMTA
jgi:hypothetical protein